MKANAESIMLTALSKWRFGLRVALLYGLCTGLAAALVVPSATWREILAVTFINVAGQVGAYIQKHPADDVQVPDDKPTTTPSP